MNERFHKLFISSSAVFTACILCFSNLLCPVLAFGSNWLSSGLYKSIGYYQGVTAVTDSSSTSKYSAMAVTDVNDSNTYPSEGSAGVLVYRNSGSSNSVNSFTIIFYSFDSNWKAWSYVSSNNISWSQKTNMNLSLTYTASDVNSTGTTVYYNRIVLSSWVKNFDSIEKFKEVYPNIPVIDSIVDVNDLLDVISLDSEILPWNYTDSSGGVHFSDGTTLDSNNSTVYNNVFNSMDINQDSSVSQEEVNYFNVTNNTNYDYSSINNDTDFDLDTFLYYVAVMLNNGNNPAGDSSTPGGGSISDSGNSSISNSQNQDQSQTQIIESNAVSVTVNNNNELSQENSQYLNNVINNNLGTEGNAFENAIGNVNGFVSVARSFSSLVGVVLGFLPAWVTTLLSLMFTILFVMIIFRLIHLFV